MSKATLSRKMHGAGGWYYTEVEAIADHFDVLPGDLAGELPPLDVWRACRDSNPEPSDLYLIVNRGLTPNAAPEPHRATLRAVS